MHTGDRSDSELSLGWAGSNHGRLGLQDAPAWALHAVLARSLSGPAPGQAMCALSEKAAICQPGSGFSRDPDFWNWGKGTPVPSAAQPRMVHSGSRSRDIESWPRPHPDLCSLQWGWGSGSGPTNLSSHQTPGIALGASHAVARSPQSKRPAKVAV